jgi:hypothetical protein
MIFLLLFNMLLFAIFGKSAETADAKEQIYTARQKVTVIMYICILIHNTITHRCNIKRVIIICTVNHKKKAVLSLTRHTYVRQGDITQLCITVNAELDELQSLGIRFR